MVIDPAFWAGRSVFVTGHTGFKGSWLSSWLLDMGAIVTGYALAPPTQPSAFVEFCLESRLHRHIVGDIADLALLGKVMADTQPSVVIHLAAQPLVRRSYEFPVETYATNVMGTVHVLESARNQASVRAVLNVTTDKCYQNNEWHWGYRETDQLGGHDPYSNSKACSELVAQAYRSSFLADRQVGLATARSGNVLGGGDWAADRIVPDAIAAFQSDTVLQVRNPAATRPWQHVLEPLAGYLMLCEQLTQDSTGISGAWNFGPRYEDVLPVSRLVSELAEFWGPDARWSADPDFSLHEAGYLKLDSSKSAEGLGWRPQWTIREGLLETVKWYKALNDGTDMYKFTLAQIRKYQESASGKS